MGESILSQKYLTSELIIELGSTGVVSISNLKNQSTGMINPESVRNSVLKKVVVANNKCERPRRICRL